jgi:hypothetical protein
MPAEGVISAEDECAAGDNVLDIFDDRRCRAAECVAEEIAERQEHAVLADCGERTVREEFFNIHFYDACDDDKCLRDAVGQFSDEHGFCRMFFPYAAQVVHLFFLHVHFLEHPLRERGACAKETGGVVDPVHCHVAREKENGEDVNIKIADRSERARDEGDDRAFYNCGGDEDRVAILDEEVGDGLGAHIDEFILPRKTKKAAPEGSWAARVAGLAMDN